MKFYGTALVTVIATTACQAFSPVSFVGRSQANVFQPKSLFASSAAELEKLKSELKEAEKQNEAMRQEMKAMESKVEKITAEVAKPPAPAAASKAAPSPAPTPMEADAAAKRLQEQRARLQKAEEERRELVEKLNSTRKTRAKEEAYKPLPHVPFDPNKTVTPSPLTSKKGTPSPVTKYDPSSVSNAQATIAAGFLGALVVGRFVLSSRDEVQEETATQRSTKSIRSTIPIKDVATGKPIKEKASTRIAAQAQADSKAQKPEPAAPAPVSAGGGSYLDSLNGSKGASSAVKSSYSPFGSKPKAPPGGDSLYRYTPPSTTTASPSPPAAAAAAASTPSPSPPASTSSTKTSSSSSLSYADSLNANKGTPMTKSSYAPFGKNYKTPPTPPPAQNGGTPFTPPTAPANSGATQSSAPATPPQAPFPPTKGADAGTKKSYLPYGRKPQGKPWNSTK